MYQTTVVLSYPSGTEAKLVESALRPEVGAIESDRTAVSMTRSGAELDLVVEAADPVALRAGQNTWLGLLEVVEAVAAMGRRFEETAES
ncbi:MAG: KEOPS complex subunit Pcc1 [Halodesulfurarchaeum sp.]|nr:KEOPS complex subunit Pcc1 [Halodesulfurarchaeum sp.]